MDSPQRWIARLAEVPEGSRAKAIESLARAWGEQSPEEAYVWATSLPAHTRPGTVAAVTTSWARRDAHSAADFVASMAAGADRDHSAGALVLAVADKYPHEAWQWAVSIQDETQRSRAMSHAAQTMAARDPATARQWIQSAPFTPEVRAQLHADVERRIQAQASRPN